MYSLEWCRVGWILQFVKNSLSRSGWPHMYQNLGSTKKFYFINPIFGSGWFRLCPRVQNHIQVWSDRPSGLKVWINLDWSVALIDIQFKSHWNTLLKGARITGHLCSTLLSHSLYLKEQTLLIFWSRTTGAYTSLFTNSIEAQQSRRSVVLFKEKSDYSNFNTHFAEAAKKQKSLNFGKPMNKLTN